MNSLSASLVSDMLLPVSCLVEPMVTEKKNVESDLWNAKNDVLDLSFVKGEKELLPVVSNKSFKQKKMESLRVDEKEESSKKKRW